MKKYIRLILLCLVAVLVLTGCSGKASYAIKVGDRSCLGSLLHPPFLWR